MNAQPSSALPVVIMGAGIGGLSAAIHLAAAGRRVIICEQNPTVGGKMGQVTAGGFRWDTGPSVITMRPVFQELFARAGRRFEDSVALQPLEPLTRYFYPDGTVLDATSDLAAMGRQIEALDPHDVEGYLSFLAYAARLHRITGPVFIYDRPPTLRSFARVPVHEWFQVDPWLTAGCARRTCASCWTALPPTWAPAHTRRRPPWPSSPTWS
jgi:phytoene desaturase